MLPCNPAPRATTSDGQENGAQNREQELHYNMQPPGNQNLVAGRKKSPVVKRKMGRGRRASSERRKRYCSKLLRDGNETEVSSFALADKEGKSARAERGEKVLRIFFWEGVVGVHYEHGYS